MLHLALGRCYEASRNEEKAQAAYRKAIQLDPRASTPRLAVARLALRQGTDAAIAEVEQGLATLPQDPGLTVALAELRFRQQMMLPPARRSWAAFDEALKRAASAAPRNPAVAMIRADRVGLDGGMEGALRVLEEAARNDPRRVSLALAWADGLARTGKPEQALQVLEHASTPEAAGDQATLRVARARLLTALGRGREARILLVRDVDRLPASERPRVWIALGQLCAGQGDRVEARKAYDQWARLLPDDPRPKLALLELDLAAGDEVASRVTIETLRTIGGPDDYAWRLAEARFLLWKRTASGASAKDKEGAETLGEAARLVDEALKIAPELPEAHRLQGQILEQLSRIDEAIAAYQLAWEQGNEAALPPLIELLASQHRFDDLTRLRKSHATLRLDRLEAQALLRLGDRDQANQLVDQVGRDQPEAQAWQAEMLDRLGRTADAEAILQKLAERQPGELEPWLVFLRYQAAHKRSPALLTTMKRIKAQVKNARPELVEARCRWAIADHPGADKAFAEALVRHPEDREVQVSAARYYEETGRLDRAEACLRHVLERNPSDRPIMRQLAVILAARAGDSKAWDDAWAVLGPELPETDTPEDRLARAIVLSRSADPARRENAVKSLEALVADLSGNLAVTAIARGYLARLLLQTSQPERASQIAAVSADSGSDPSSIALYAEALLQSKKLDAAAAQLERLEAIKPGDALGANLRARLIRASSQPAEAASALENAYLAREDTPAAEAFGREAFRQLVEISPESAERLARRIAQRRPSASWMPALLALRNGHREEALALCRTAVQAGNPGDALEACRISLEAVVTPGGEPASKREALEVLDAALKLTPGSSDLLAMKAVLHHLEQRYDEEVRLYRVILARQPKSPLILNNLAWTLSEGLHQPSEAMTHIEQFVKLSGRVPEALDTRGRVLIRLGRLDDAIKDLEEVVRAEPTGPHLYHLAYAYHKAGRGNEFRKTIEQMRRAGLTALALDPTERTEFETLLGP